MNYTYSVTGFSVAGVDGQINQTHVVSGIKDQILNDGISVYPNPAKASFISIRNDNMKTYSLEIYNTIGQLVKTSPIDENPVNTVNIENLSPGIYIIRLKNSDGEITRKLIIE